MPARRYALALLSAVAFAAALPNELIPFGSPLLGLVALTPLVLALYLAPDTRSAARIGVLFGAVSTILSNYWLMFFGEFSVWTIGGATLGYMLYNALLGPYLWLALRAPAPLRPFTFAATWTAYELLKSVGFLGYPWGLSSYPFNTLLPVIQIADVTGVYGIGFLAVAIQALLAELCIRGLGLERRGPSRVSSFFSGSQPGGAGTGRIKGVLRAGAFTGMLLVAVLAYGNLRLAAEVPVRKRLDTVMVQQNADSWVRGNEVATIRTSQRLTRAGLRELAEPPDLVMWSETALRYRYVEDRRFYESNPAEEPFVDFVRESGVPLLTGAPYTEPSTGDWFNATLLIAPDTRVVEYYGKRQLVPFAENVPLWDVPFVRRFFNEVIGLPATWSPGPEETIFDLELGDGSSLRFATPICFEDAFAAINRRFVRGGAEALINLTNNSWSRTDSAQTQHFVASRFRAIENRRTLIRSTNSGLSGVVDPHGRLIEQAPMFEETFLTASIPIRYPSGLTVYTRAGDWFPLVMLGFVYLWMGAYVVDRHRKGSAVGPL